MTQFVMATRAVPPFTALHVVSDSKYMINGLTKHLPEWEKKGWIGVANERIFQEAAAALRVRSAPTTFRWVKGHSGNRGNEEADRLAGIGALKPRPVVPANAPPQAKYIIPGASLQDMTQKRAYKGIKKWKGHTERAATARTLQRVQEETKRVTGTWTTAARAWKMLRKDPIQRKVRDFLWKSIHEAHKVGKYWKNIPGYENRATCNVCGAEDSMEHILTECNAPGQKEAWNLACAMLRKKGLTLGTITLGIALGGHSITCKDENGHIQSGCTRLARIVISETAHLVWALRCERVIGWEHEPEKRHTTKEVEARWTQAMNKRLQMDRALTNKRAAGKRALAEEVVLETWRTTLQDENVFPHDWIKTPGVLVGRPITRVAAGEG
ncbi:RnaseH-domain-containing protein [Trametes meyenii]|nr:RnaseH-domain-containing protein [Trametes meyenii]